MATDITGSVVHADSTKKIPYSSICDYARSCWDLIQHNGRIYVGAGQAGSVAGFRCNDVTAGQLKYYDTSTGLVTNSGITPSEQQIRTFKLGNSNKLFIPGSDDISTSNLENFIEISSSNVATTRSNVFTNTAHCFDLQEFGGQLFAATKNSGGSTFVKIASDGIGATSGAWADASISGFAWDKSNISFVANGKIYFSGSISVPLGQPWDALYVYAGTGTTVSGTGKQLLDVFPSTFTFPGGAPSFVNRNGTVTAVDSAIFWRFANFGTKVFYIGGEVLSDHQCDPYGLYSVTESGTLNAGLNLSSFANIAHPNAGSYTRLKPMDLWTDGTSLRCLWNGLDGSSNWVTSLCETTDGSTWTELRTFIAANITGTAGGQIGAMSYEYYSGFDYYGLGSLWGKSTDTAVQSNNGELLKYDTAGGGGGPTLGNFLLDDGTGTLNANLSTRASTLGGTAALVPGLGVGQLKFDGNGSIYGAANSFWYWPSATPAGTDQTIIGEFDVVTLLATPGPALGMRVDDSVTTGLGKAYWLRYVTGNWTLTRFWTGVTTPGYTVATPVAYSLSGITKFYVRFRTSGTTTVSLVVDISINDMVTWTNIFNTTHGPTNDPITVAGRPGLSIDESTATSTTGTHLNRIWAFDYPETTKPVFANSSVGTSGLVCTVNLTEAENPVIRPLTGVTGFTVKVGGVSRTISSATASGTAVTLNLTPAVLSTDTVTVEYSPGNVTDNAVSPNSMDAFTAQSVTNNSTQTADTTKPVFASASVPSLGSTVAVVLTETGSPPILPATGVTGFTVLVNAVSRTITSGTAASTTVTLNLATPVLIGDTVTVSYTPGNITDSATSPNSMNAFTAQSVTNSSSQSGGGDTTAPVFASASVPSNGNTVAVVLTETGSSPVLPATGVTGFAVTVGGSSRSVSSATASGTTVTLTLSSPVYINQTVTVAYTPGNVTDSSANAMVSFGAQSVTNSSTTRKTITMTDPLIYLPIPELFGSIGSSSLKTTLQGASLFFAVTVANTEDVAMTFNTTGFNGATAGTTPTFSVEMDGLPLDLNSDGLAYKQFTNSANTQTVTLKASPTNGRHVFRFQVRSFTQISGATLGSWGSGGAVPPTAVDITGITLGGTSVMAALVPGTDYYTDTALVFGHSRTVGVLATLGFGSTTTTASAANNSTPLSWPSLMRQALQCEIGWIGQGGCDLSQQAGTFVDKTQTTSPVNPPMYGAAGAGTGEMFSTYHWNGNARTFAQTHKYIFIMQGVLGTVTTGMIQGLISTIRTACGATPYIFWVIDPTRVNLATMQSALGTPLDSKVKLLDPGFQLMDGSTANRYATDGSHMNAEGQARLACGIIQEMKRIVTVASGGGGGGLTRITSTTRGSKFFK